MASDDAVCSRGRRAVVSCRWLHGPDQTLVLISDAGRRGRRAAGARRRPAETRRLGAAGRWRATCLSGSVEPLKRDRGPSRGQLFVRAQEMMIGSFDDATEHVIEFHVEDRRRLQRSLHINTTPCPVCDDEDLQGDPRKVKKFCKSTVIQAND